MSERADGRAPDELRPVSFEERAQRHPMGSLLISMGETRVLCAATLEQTVPLFLKGSGHGWVTAEYGMLPASTATRTPRDGTRGRTIEIQRLIGRSLRAVTNLQGFGERTIRVDCDVLQADGGTRTAAITGGFMVLVQAFKKMMGLGEIVQLPIKDQLAAVSVGKIGSEMLLDLDYLEDSAAEVDMNVVMTGSGEFVEIQGTAEEGAFSREELDVFLDLAAEGIRELHRLQLSRLQSVGLM